MTNSRENDKSDNLGFSWGKKNGGKNKDAQFYESFVYDGMEYFLYDSVYLFKEGEPEPYIGKLTKIWEHSERTRRVKILWFFKPSEISYYLRDEKVLVNELFLASGEGVGLTNINPLEAIAGKCNVICISKDERNFKPSYEELEKVNYVFYRTFDVGNSTISDKLGEKVAAIDVRFLLNKKDFQPPDVNPINKNVDNVAASIDKPPIFIKDTPEGDEAIKPDANIRALVEEGRTKDTVDMPKLHASKNRVGAGSDDAEPVIVCGLKAILISPDTSQGDLGKFTEFAHNVGPSEYKTLLNSKLGVSGADGVLKTNVLIDSGTNSVKKLLPSVAADDKGMSEPENYIRRSIGAVGKVKSINASGAMGERPSKKLKLDGTAAPSGDKGRNGTLKSAAVFNVINKASRPAAADTAEPNGGGNLAEEFDGSSNSKKLKSKCLGSGSGAAVASENNGGGKFCKDLIGTSSDFSKKLKSKCVGFGFAAAVAAETNDRGKLGKEIVGTSNSISKKLGSEGTMEDKSNERLPMTSLKQSLSIEIEAYGCVKEVTRRPETGRRDLFDAAHWNVRMKAAQDRGTLVLLQNLDPAYTSSEVEDIVWHGLGESCTAKMVQRTATSSPHSGKAFVIFKTREAAEKVSYKLEQECLMLPNRRLLVGSPWVASFAGKQSSFPGHLVIDKLKHQLQREAKAVSTSHSSQPNTLEYEMSLEWRLLQDREDLWWRKLYKQQGGELRELKASFKRK